MLSICLLIGYTIPNLGRFLDIQQKPSSSDVIACLSGCDKYRLAKTVELYREGYSKTDTIILTSPEPLQDASKTNKYCHDITTQLHIEKVYPETIVCTRQISNTMQELMAVKAYLITHRLHSSLIVTDPPITRRATFLLDKVAKFGESRLKATIIGSDAPWWDREQYYHHKIGTIEVILEVVKLPYNAIKYVLLYNLFVKYNILEDARELFSPIESKIKHDFSGFLWK